MSNTVPTPLPTPMRTLLVAPAQARVGDVVEVRATVAHPMETGYRTSSEGQRLPRNLVRSVRAQFNGQTVFAAQLHAAVSANPYVAFWLRVPASGELVVQWQADGGASAEARATIQAT